MHECDFQRTNLSPHLTDLRASLKTQVMPGNPLLKGKEKSGNNSRGNNGVDNGECTVATSTPVSDTVLTFSRARGGRPESIFDAVCLNVSATRLTETETI